MYGIVETMASKEYQPSDLRTDQSIRTRRKEKGVSSDPLFDHDWEVFVIHRDDATGELSGHTLLPEIREFC